VAARFRAVENRAGVVRSDNNGLSGLIDPLGRSEILLGKNAIGNAMGQLWITQSGSLYTKTGDWPAVAVSGLVLMLVLSTKASPSSTATQQGIMSALYEDATKATGQV